MQIAVFLAAASTFIMSATAAGVRVCHGSGFKDCVDRYGEPGHCIYVGAPYNDHVYSAKALSGTCDSYRDINNGACSGLLVSGIDTAGYSGLPYGHQTSGFVCR
jgi:hypothetical protein